MTFGGGGGVSTVGAHQHTNAAGDGGSLNSASLINSRTLLGLILSFRRDSA
mgnify:CR=1 FL=1